MREARRDQASKYTCHTSVPLVSPLSFADVHAIICQTKRAQEIADGRYVPHSCLINIVILGLIKLDQLTRSPKVLLLRCSRDNNIIG